MNNLQSIVESAVKRKLTQKEADYIEWLLKMDYETIEIFSKLFEDAANS